MIRYAIAAVVLLLGCSSWDEARAANCSAYPYTLQNGQVADANQVMANFNSVLNCGNTNLLGAANNLSDVGSASTSRTNLGLGASAVENLNSNVVDDGSGNLYSKSSLNVQVVTGSSFTVPAGVKSTTVFKITIIGGGAGGGSAVSAYSAGGGGSGGVATGWFSGLTAGQTMAITQGAAGNTSGGSGGNGGTTTLFSPNSTQIMTCSGGGVGTSSGGGAPLGGGAGTCDVEPLTSGLTLQGSLVNMDQSGGPGAAGYLSGAGGGNAFGYPGQSLAAGSALNGQSATGYGAGGSGGTTTGATVAGGAGARGVAIFEWVQ